MLSGAEALDVRARTSEAYS